MGKTESLLQTADCLIDMPDPEWELHSPGMCIRRKAECNTEVISSGECCGTVGAHLILEFLVIFRRLSFLA